MKYVLKGIFSRFVFWMLYFALLRLVFITWYQKLINIEGISFQETLLSFWNALPLDISTTCYLVSVSYILLLFRDITGKRFFLTADKLFGQLMIWVIALISTAEIGLYTEWNSKLSFKALSYLTNPDEVFNSVSTLTFLALVAIWVLQAVLPLTFFNRLVIKNPVPERRKVLSSGWTLIFMPLLIFVGIRGGISEIPISTSASYFSQYQLANHAAVNSAYNLMVSTLNTTRIGRVNPFTHMPAEEAIQITTKLHETPCDSTLSILKIAKPNIVFLLLESWSADLIESLGGEPGITPQFKKLEKDGLLFTHFYASGNRTQQAMGSLFAGLPGLPVTTITSYPEKYSSLPSFVHDLKKAGYHSSFWFGGQLIYGNILSYLMHNQFDEIVEGKDLSSDFGRGKLGVHDEFLLRHTATKLNFYPQPFFSTIFTLSSHSPYDFPMEHHIQWPETEKEYVNSAFYTDRSVGEFFMIARQQPWYDSTLFLIMGDHSHKSYKNHPLESFEHHKIPLLIYGPALKDEFRGKTFDQIAGNTDVPATLLAQLGINSNDYFWSKNVFNSCYQPFAFFELNDGFGFMRSDGYLVWNQVANRDFQKKIPDSLETEITMQGKAYMQTLVDEFIGY
ncbi:MAG: sulfatase-like hydrolase/transferase [Bacteroidales bacterium]|nr:sulfatase-like hydrolase/transferase [Bacteroidales bacterium]